MALSLDGCCHPAQEAESLGSVTVALGQSTNTAPGQTRPRGCCGPSPLGVTREVGILYLVGGFGRRSLPLSGRPAAAGCRAGPWHEGRAAVRSPAAPGRLWRGRARSSLSRGPPSSHQLPPAALCAVSRPGLRPPQCSCAGSAHTSRDGASAASVHSFRLPLSKHVLSATVCGGQLVGR